MKKQLTRKEWIVYTNLIKEAHMEVFQLFSILRMTFPKYMLQESEDKLHAGFLRLKSEMDDELATQIPEGEFFGLAYGSVIDEE